MLRKTLTILFLSLSIIFFVVWIGHVILRSMEYMYTFSRFIPFHLGWIMFGLSGLSMYFCLMIYSEGLLIKLLLTGVAFTGFVVIVFGQLWSGITYKKVVTEGYVLIEEEEYAFRMGTVTIYQHLNLLISKKFALCHTGSDVSCTYEVIDDVLYLHICGTTPEESCDIRTYPLQEQP